MILALARNRTNKATKNEKQAAFLSESLLPVVNLESLKKGDAPIYKRIDGTKQYYIFDFPFSWDGDDESLDIDRLVTFINLFALLDEKEHADLKMAKRAVRRGELNSVYTEAYMDAWEDSGRIVGSMKAYRDKTPKEERNRFDALHDVAEQVGMKNQIVFFKNRDALFEKLEPVEDSDVEDAPEGDNSIDVDINVDVDIQKKG